MSQRIQIRQVVSYGGHSVSAKGVVTLTLKSNYSQLVHTIEATQLLNNDITVKAKMPMAKPMGLGDFRIKSIAIDGDGASTLKFSGVTDYIELDSLNALSMQDADQPEFAIMYDAHIEEEGEDDDD